MSILLAIITFFGLLFLTSLILDIKDNIDSNMVAFQLTVIGLVSLIATFLLPLFILIRG